MELLCYLYPGWEPRIRPASARRDWMDATPESFAYRCLPLSIANAHGWELLSPCGFEAVWRGGSDASEVVVTPDPGTRAEDAPVALFGQGTVTFHVAGLFRTPPGWNLWVGGSPNSAKDGIAPLGGVIETDWSPYSFTMNWRFTRPNHPIRFEKDEPFAFIFPVERNALEQMTPRLLPIDSDPALKERFEKWSRARDAFHQEMQLHPSDTPSDKWQKFYYRGTDSDGVRLIDDHQSKLRLAPFAAADVVPPPAAGAKPSRCPVAAPPPPHDASLAKRDWLLTMLERQRALSTRASSILRYEGISAEDFLDEHYATNRPAMLAGELEGWPALARWTPAYLRQKLGARMVEYQGGRQDNAGYEREKDAHRRTIAFDAFIDMISAEGAGNDAYITAYNSAQNADALSPLHEDLGFIDRLLTRDCEHPHGMLWIGPAGTFTPLHHDLTNNLLLQLVGRKSVLLASPGETPRLYNDRGVFSEIQDLEAGDELVARYPKLAGLRIHRVQLNPGDALFVPVGWWHQVRALDFSVTATHTNFIWPNDVYASYPSD